MVPFNARPPVTRCDTCAWAMSMVPPSAALFRKLAPLKPCTTSLPVPVVLMLPPLMAVPNWLTTLPAAMLITPPVLFKLCPPAMPRLAVLIPPTLMVPVLLVLPPLTRFSPKACSVICPALFRLSTCCPVLMVTTPAAPMVAVSAAPGTPPGLPLPVTQAVQLMTAAQLPAAVFQVQLAALAGAAAKVASKPATARLQRFIGW